MRSPTDDLHTRVIPPLFFSLVSFDILSSCLFSFILSIPLLLPLLISNGHDTPLPYPPLTRQGCSPKVKSKENHLTLPFATASKTLPSVSHSLAFLPFHTPELTPIAPFSCFLASLLQLFARGHGAMVQLIVNTLNITLDCRCSRDLR